MATTGLALGIHDGVQSQRVSASAGSTDDVQAFSGMEVLMRKLFSEHKVEVKQTMESTIASQIQPLSNAISQERIERVQVICQRHWMHSVLIRLRCNVVKTEMTKL